LKLSANIEIEEDLKALKRVNADGVGLYRTEFLYMNRDTIPTEQEHFKAYTKALRALKGETLTIRTADLGADKQMNSTVAVVNRPQSHNPAMGLRGIRLCLNDTQLFIPQLRAILRASAKGPIRMLLPMLTSISEVEQCLKLIEQTKQKLRDENIAQVNYLYDPLHPAVLDLIRMTIDAGQKAGIPVAMCGEMAGDIRYTRILLGLGLTGFSMPPNLILETKKHLIATRRSTLKKQVSNLMAANSTEKRVPIIEKINATGTK